MTEDPVPIKDVLSWCEENALWFGGHWGCYYADIRRYFLVNGYDVDCAGYDDLAAANRSNDYKILNVILDSSDVVIMSFWNKPIIYGIHTVTIQKNEDGRILVYNYNNGSTEARDFDNLEEYLSENGRLLSYFGASRRN